MKSLDLFRACGLPALGISLLLSACNADKIWEPTDPPAAGCGDMGAKPDADLAMPTKKALCKAAEGLPGGDDPATAIVCVDFASTSIEVLKQPQHGWEFGQGVGCQWAIQGNKYLVNSDLANLTGGCQVKLPQKLLNTQQNRVTIAVVQSGTVLNNHNLRLSLMLTDPSENALLSSTALSNEQLIVRTSRTDPRINNNLLAPIVHHAKGAGAGAPSGPGWQIESIAVIATP